MRIALLVPGGMDPNGRETLPYLQDLVAELAATDDVEVFALVPAPDPPSFELGGVLVHNVGGLRGARALSRILSRHRERPFDVLHAFWASPQGIVAAAAGRLRRIPTVLHLAGGELVRLEDVEYGGAISMMGRLKARMALRGADRVTVASAGMRALASDHGIPVSLVPLGVSLRRWPPRPPVRRDPAAPIRLLQVASLNRVKDQPTLLRTARILVDRGVPFTLDIVGTDTLDGQVEREARRLDLETDRVRFHGFLPQPELRPLVEAADLLLVTSRHEAGPVAMLEAAVAGVPTVGTAVGHVRDWAPEAALAVAVGDAAALAAAVESLSLDEDRRLEIAARAHARGLGTGADNTAERFSGIYRELTGAPSGNDGVSGTVREPTAGDFTIRPLEPDDLPGVAALFEEVFGRPMSVEEARWKLLEPPGADGTPCSFVAEADGRIVGQYAGTPTRFLVEGREVRGLHGCDVMTAPAFRRRGILTALGTRAHDVWRREGIALVVGLASDAWGSRSAALSWVEVFSFRWLVAPLRPQAVLARRWGLEPMRRLGVLERAWWALPDLRARRDPSVSVEPICRAGEELDELWRDVRPRLDLSVVRDRARVDWRYLGAPAGSYSVLVARRGGRAVGYLALGRPSPTRGIIAEIFTDPSDDGARGELLWEARRRLRADGVEVLSTLAVPGSPVWASCRRSGFVPRASYRFEFVRLDEGLEQAHLSDARLWTLAGGDFDVV